MLGTLIGAEVGAAVGVGAAPVALTAMGFTGTGIAAASIAAKMMSAAAIANGGGVAAGSLVATLQSVGKCPSRQDDWRDSQGWHLPASPSFSTLYITCVF
ncbi:interferon alpha-inducible protein 27-like protein 2A isoform X1 [Arvicola amphibius]|uniref:interferon alpha-inducible protein 27-like protein 2A isoform X1 n=1 Tax=Arvicola amphibius TaxID=1047088 RepID=UPI0018E33A77|nr:interferon alpha-inducible protein 27-like protein 2A isoform X1 [Arvicola amphibius]